MKKLVFILLVAIITVIYGIVGALIFMDIQTMQAPETTVKLDFIEINSDEAIIKTMIEVANPNSFQITTRDFEIAAITETGKEVTRVLIEGGDIPPQKERTFTATAHISFDGESPSILTTRITSKIGVNFLGFIKKTLPIDINLVTSIDDVLEDLDPPVIHIKADFSEITQDGVNITALLDVYNPNSFDIYVDNISVDIETETEENVGYIDITGGVINAKSSLIFNGTGKIIIEALNAKILIVNTSALAGVNAAGVNKSISVNTETHITMPDLEDLLSSNVPTDIIIRGDYRFTAGGIVIDAALEINNPNKITFIASDIICAVYRVDNGEEELIGYGCLEEGEIPAGESTTLLKGELKIPYSKVFISKGKRLLPDWLLLRIRGNVTIPGLEQSLWVGISGYQDLHPFR